MGPGFGSNKGLSAGTKSWPEATFRTSGLITAGSEHRGVNVLDSGRLRTSVDRSCFAGAFKGMCSSGADARPKGAILRSWRSPIQGLCKFLAAAFSIDGGLWPNHRPLDVAACARLSSLRCGEASHPGPRRPAVRTRHGNLADVELLEPVTVALRSKLWNLFLIWAKENLGTDAMDDWARSSPESFATVLVSYGHNLFEAGSSLHYFRQLAAHCQKTYIGLKPFMSSVWDLATRWQSVEPTEHRPPIPESVTFAMVSLAWLWGWKRWAAVTLYTFSAISRVGEVLRARRMDALTPRDILFEQHVIYLKVNFPKTRHRGPRVQYSSAEWDTCVSLVSKVWDELMPDEFLFPGSQAAYRFRWDALLKHLKISSSFKLTPGSLRGGGAVSAHRRKVAIEQIMWKMRIVHMKTLTFYLQEVAASSILPQLTARVRSDILLLRDLMPVLTQH